MPLLACLLCFPLFLLPIAHATETGTHFLIDLDSQQILSSTSSRNNMIQPSFLEGTLQEIVSSHLNQANRQIKTSKDLLKIITRIPIQQWNDCEKVHLNSDQLLRTTKQERDILTSETTKIISHQNIDNHWSGVHFSKNPQFNGSDRHLLVILTQYSNELDLLKTSAQLIESGHWNFALHTIFKKGQIIGQAPVFKGSQSQVRFVIHNDIKITLPKKLDFSNLTIDLTHKVPLIAPLDTHTPLGHVTVRLKDQVLASSPFFAEVPIETGNFAHRLCDTIRLVIFPQ